MKRTLHPPLLLGTLLAVLTAPLSAQEAEKEEKKHLSILDEQHQREIQIPESLRNAMTNPAGTWWSTHYVQGLGLSLFDEGIVPVPKPKYSDKVGFGFEPGPDGKNVNKLLSAEENVITNNPMADVYPARPDTATQTGRGDLDNIPFFPLVLLRLQDDLTSKPFDAQPGTFLWSNDSDKGDSTMVNAALLADLYFSGIGKIGRYSSKGLFHVLIGGELEKFDGGDPNSEIDIRRYLAMAEFSPGGLLGIHDGGPNYMRQTMTVGWLHEDDEINDTQRNSFQVKLAPSFNLPGALNMFVGERSYFRKWFKFWDPEDINKVIGRNAVKMAETTTKSQLQGDKAEQTASKAKTSPMDDQARAGLNGMAAAAAVPVWTGEKFDNFFYFRPKVGLDYGDTSASSLLKDRELPDLNLVYTLEAGFSFLKETYHLGYRLNGFSGISKGENFTSNEFFLQATPHGWPGRFFVTYKRGEIAPSFVNVDVLQVGIGLKF